MGVITLGIGDLGATKNPDDKIKTYALGSCVAMVLLDPKTRAVGMAHIALPDSSVDTGGSQGKRAGYFADHAIPALLKEMSKLGADPRGKGMIVKLVGGATIADKNNVFNIGKRNVLAIKKILWQYGMGPKAEDVGGNISRTVTLEAKNGRVTISSAKREEWTI